jgi:hypothetical protein
MALSAESESKEIAARDTASFFFCGVCRSRCNIYEVKGDVPKLVYFCERCRAVAGDFQQKIVYQKQYGALNHITPISHYEYDNRTQLTIHRCPRGHQYSFIKNNDMSFRFICECDDK